MSLDPREIEAIYRREAGRVLATLIRLLDDFELAEEARQEAFASALEHWPDTGVPENPRAWLVATGRNRALDQLRRNQVFKHKVLRLEKAAAEAAQEPSAHPDEAFGDDRLRLIFTCCHPAIAPAVQVALTLRAVCGLSTEAVARAFLVGEEAMAQRLVRAQHKIREAGIPYEIPEPPLLDERMQSVLAVIYSVFTEGYSVTSGEALISAELCLEAIRLARLVEALLPGRADVQGLLALMLLHDARRRARLTQQGDIVLLEHQDAALWDQAQIAEGLLLVEKALTGPGRVSAYAVQAAIAALHARAPAQGATDWPQIAALYEVLLRLQPTPVVELNRAVAISMVDGPAKALPLVESLAARGGFKDYHLLHVVRADLLRRLQRGEEAKQAYRQALEAARTEPERRFLEQRLSEL
ncbi:MAG TPA: RNA polymerase sigma factor [Gammaproteobacteria bacterium]|jgi:RNA polymerase sigma-70 factor (ECF subfamily)